jgi:hypothetical protein
MSWADGAEKSSPEPFLGPIRGRVRGPRYGAMSAMSTQPRTPSNARTARSWPLLARLASAGLSASELAAFPSQRRQRVLCLSRCGRHDERAALSLLGELAPELCSIRHRLVRLGVEEDCTDALTLSVAWEVVSGRRGGRGPRSVRVLQETIWRAARQEAGIRRHDHETVALGDHFDVALGEPDHLERWPGFLAAALAAGVLSVRQVVIVAQSRMDERPLAEVARTLGRPYDAVRMERRRAERALAVFARSYDWGATS